MKGDVLLDSNILVYAYDSDAGKKHEIARSFLESCYKGQASFFVSVQNLNEFYVVVTSKIERPMGKEAAIQRIQNMVNFDGFRVLVPSEKTIFKAANLDMKPNSHYWDCFLTATMIENNVFRIYTENTKDFNFHGISAENPFKQI